ncbi:GSCFA domain-containing protein [Tamlana sp. 2_MG-2023]|uniref:GSCFA domain-containing protein n=1 Tax=unclassified Tamlana TaxID=2614803 RepID=UPI0026E23AB8|nr:MULTISPECIES: GSCFA domain-containing protein [unclassified Tamlana]MDO6761374.1 GSCFA domain-containing protein [Tamlana sp. 2_MG-2023]MDO6792012.1 GSCFA domain-containing protein [Tamlana sp. 1_MG-2023]
MNLQTKIVLEKQSEYLIDYNSNLLMLGSCFSENIGEKLAYFKFQNIQNPFGILFHPLAIQTLVSNAVEKKIYTGDDVFFQNEQWHSFDAHSKLSHSSKETLISKLNENVITTHEALDKASHVIITLGTAWVYRFIETQKVVANCHKIPQKQFLKNILSVQEIYEVLQEIEKTIRRLNSKAVIVFTVSPVRHLKDGFVENTQSKAHLISAIHQFLNQNKVSKNGDAFYFPSYEIMMDELRDYRFYAEDMVHPNPLAIQYIWEKFKSVWVSEETSKTMDTVDGIQKGLQHRAFNENSEAHQKFLQNLNEKMRVLQATFPQIKF